LFSSVGVALVVHYCGGEIASISSVLKDKDNCEEDATSSNDCCGSNKTSHDNCCSNETLNIDIDDVVIKNFDFKFNFVAVLFETQKQDFNKIKILNNNQSLDYYCDANAPPFYKLYSQRIFYA